MLEWLDGLAGPQYTTALLWTFAALALLVIVLVIIKLIRGLTFGTFVAGGRNRKTRLAVMDATAIDSHRRLVLVRRDDIEHLLLIGGPTDVVVERDIRLLGQPQQRRPGLTGEGIHPVPPAPQPARPRPPEAQPRPAPQPVERRPAPQPALPVRAQQAPLPEMRPAPPHHIPPAVLDTLPSLSQPAPRPPVLRPSPMQQPRPVAQPAPRETIDDALLHELEVTFDDAPPPPAPVKPAISLDDEMTKLLGELSSHKR